MLLQRQREKMPILKDQQIPLQQISDITENMKMSALIHACKPANTTTAFKKWQKRGPFPSCHGTPTD